MAVTGRYLFTQPESILCIVAVVLIYFGSHLDSNSISEVLINFVHITSFSLFVGMSFWVTFIAGLTMYPLLPRHLFSKIQCALFPKFVRYCLIFSTLSLVSYYIIISGQQESLVGKLSGLVICFVGSVLACVMVNPLISAILKRNEFEEAEKIGQGLGNDNEGVKKLKETNQTYNQLYGRVVKLHGASAFTNLISVVGIAIHLSVLANNVKFV